MDTIVFYVHGFNSGAKSSTVARVTEALGDGYHVVPLHYNSGNDYYTNMIDLLAQINHVAIDYPLDNVVIIGTSLGAYYAHQLSQKLAIGCIMINPAIKPKDVLAKFIGDNTNYVTGEKYRLLASVVDSYPEMLHLSRIATTVYVSKNDELITDNVQTVEKTLGNAVNIVVTDTKHRIDDFAKLEDFKHNVNMCSLNLAIFED